jgi:hypothetical protein
MTLLQENPPQMDKSGKQRAGRDSEEDVDTPPTAVIKF